MIHFLLPFQRTLDAEMKRLLNTGQIQLKKALSISIEMVEALWENKSLGAAL